MLKKRYSRIIRLACAMAAVVCISAAAGCTEDEKTDTSAAAGAENRITSSTESTESSAGAVKEESEAKSSSEKSEAAESNAEESKDEEDEEAGRGEAIWKATFDSAVKLDYSWSGEGLSAKMEITDKSKIDELVKRLKAATINGASELRVADDSTSLTFYDKDGDSYQILIEGDFLLKDGITYECTGMREVNQHLAELTASESGQLILEETESPEDSSAETQGGSEESQEESAVGLSDQDIKDIAYVDNAIRELSDSDEYRNASVSDRVRMASDLLAELEGKGLIKNILITDDLLSFQYACDVLGGIKCGDFDPLMN